MDTNKIFFMADTHAFHKNMAIGESRWEDKDVSSRQFPNAVLMTEHIAKLINETVPEDGTIYFIGDWSFNGVDKIRRFRSMINCKNIIFIYGNHDDAVSKGGFEDIFTLVLADLTLCIDGETLYLSHMPIPEEERVLQEDCDNTIYIHGHMHGKRLPKVFKGIRIDVGIDTNNLKPYTWEQIIQIAKAKKKFLKKTL